MLGLGTGIHLSIKPRTIVGSYYSNFTSNVNDWTAFSVQDSASDLTLSANEDIPSGSGGGWLKGAYGVTQTNQSGITRSGGDMGLIQMNSGDEVIIKFKVYLRNVSGEDWGGTDNVNITVSYMSDTFSDTEVTQDGEYEFEVTKISDGTSGGSMTIKFNYYGDMPQEDAEFYIKDISLEVWR